MKVHNSYYKETFEKSWPDNHCFTLDPSSIWMDLKKELDKNDSRFLNYMGVWHTFYEAVKSDINSILFHPMTYFEMLKITTVSSFSIDSYFHWSWVFSIYYWQQNRTIKLIIMKSFYNWYFCNWRTACKVQYWPLIRNALIRNKSLFKKKFTGY